MHKTALAIVAGVLLVGSSAHAQQATTKDQLIDVVRPPFGQIFSSAHQYRMTGVVLLKLQPDTAHQLDLFGETLRAERIRQVYTVMDALNRKYGKYTIYLGSSHPAITRARHDSARGDLPE